MQEIKNSLISHSWVSFMKIVYGISQSTRSLRLQYSTLVKDYLKATTYQDHLHIQFLTYLAM
jgi:hypothetical protein